MPPRDPFRGLGNRSSGPAKPPRKRPSKSPEDIARALVAVRERIASGEGLYQAAFEVSRALHVDYTALVEAYTGQ